MKKAPAAKSTAKPAAKAAAKPATKTAAKPASTKPAAAGKSQPSKGAAKAAEPPKLPPVTPIHCDIREIKKVLDDESETIKKSGRYPIVIDPSERVHTFLRYTYSNFIHFSEIIAKNPAENRMPILGALRYGKLLAIEIDEAKNMETLKEKFDEILPGLLYIILDKKLDQEENFAQLIKPSDGEEYKLVYFSPSIMAEFKLVIVTKDPGIPPVTLNRFIPIYINE